MKTSPKVIAALQSRLVSELTARNQYAAHLAFAKVAGYTKLAAYISERIADEDKHVGALANRLVLGETVPDVTRIDPIKTASDFAEALRLDLASETQARADYNADVGMCIAEGDAGTRVIFETILADEEDHIEDAEQRLAQIEAMGIDNWLSAQL